MISANHPGATAAQAEIHLLRKSLLLTTISFLVIAGISMYGSERLDYAWTGVLLIAALLAWKFKSPLMYIVYAVIMGWAALVDGLSLLFGEGTDKWWTVLGLVQIAWIFVILRQYKKYRHLEAEKRSAVSNQFARGSAIIAAITLFSPPCAAMIWSISRLLLDSQVPAAQSSLADQLFTPVIFALAYLAVLALGLGLAAIIPEKTYTGVAIFGVLMSLLVLAGVWALILLGLIADLFT